ncbi:unnamed protein product [Protopolystoma xenopodis]|uniref:Uncharacterized protein n=1 Tax=Protopolystoma xenopodis TaxID=117903 RepID=A0A3S5CHB2_9PLAT|nr:unnamed protein product [Protopolystoma xenopodis]
MDSLISIGNLKFTLLPRLWASPGMNVHSSCRLRSLCAVDLPSRPVRPVLVVGLAGIHEATQTKPFSMGLTLLCRDEGSTSQIVTQTRPYAPSCLTIELTSPRVHCDVAYL